MTSLMIIMTITHYRSHFNEK